MRSLPMPRAFSRRISASTVACEARIPFSSSGPWRSSAMMSYQARMANPPLSVTGGFADRKSTRLNSSHGYISYAGFCLKKKNQTTKDQVYAQNEMLTDHQKESTARVASIMAHTNLSTQPHTSEIIR